MREAMRSEEAQSLRDHEGFEERAEATTLAVKKLFNLKPIHDMTTTTQGSIQGNA